MPDVVDPVWIKTHNPDTEYKVYELQTGIEQTIAFLDTFVPYQATVDAQQATIIDLQATVEQLVIDLAALVTEHNAQGDRLDVLDPP